MRDTAVISRSFLYDSIHKTIRFVLQTHVLLDNDLDYSYSTRCFAHAIKIDPNYTPV